MALSRAVFALKAAAVTYFAQSLFGSVVGVVMLSWFIALLLAHQFAETVPAARALVDGVNKTMSGFSSALSFGFISMPNFALAVSAVLRVCSETGLVSAAVRRQ